MPIHSPGYRSWEGDREPAYTRSLVIATTGVKRASQSKWLRRLFLATVLPLLFVSVPLFMFEHAARDPSTAGRAIRAVIRDLPRHGRMEKLRHVNLATASPSEVSEVRHTIWSFATPPLSTAQASRLTPAILLLPRVQSPPSAA